MLTIGAGQLTSMLLTFAAGGGLGELSLEHDAVPYSTKHVLASLGERHSRIKAFDVEYHSTEPHEPFSIHRRVAVQLPDDCYFHTAKAPVSRDVDRPGMEEGWERDYFQECFIISDERRRRLFPISRQVEDAEWKAEWELPGKVNREFLFAALGWWPFESRPFPRTTNRACLVIPDMVCSAEYRLLTRYETYHGIRCCVLESSGRDRIWLDDRRGFAFVARIFYDEQSGRPVQRIEMSDHREVIPGIWMPFEFRNVLFDRDGGEKDNKVLSDASVRVVRAEVGGVSDGSLFERRELPGTITVHEDGTYRQVVPGGVSVIEEAVSLVQRYREESATFRSNAVVWSTGAVVACVLTFVGVVLVRMRARDGIMEFRHRRVD